MPHDLSLLKIGSIGALAHEPFAGRCELSAIRAKDEVSWSTEFKRPSEAAVCFERRLAQGREGDIRRRSA
jgi:hypothetical protein